MCIWTSFLWFSAIVEWPPVPSERKSSTADKGSNKKQAPQAGSTDFFWVSTVFIEFYWLLMTFYWLLLTLYGRRCPLAEWFASALGKLINDTDKWNDTVGRAVKKEWVDKKEEGGRSWLSCYKKLRTKVGMKKRIRMAKRWQQCGTTKRREMAVQKKHKRNRFSQGLTDPETTWVTTRNK